MTPREARHQLATSILAALPADEGWTSYPSPPEGVSVPCVVLAPRSPYRVKATVCDEEVRLLATILVARNASQAGLDYMDDRATLVRAAVNTGPAMAWVDEVQDVGLIQEVGGVEYLAATLTITLQV